MRQPKRAPKRRITVSQWDSINPPVLGVVIKKKHDGIGSDHMLIILQFGLSDAWSVVILLLLFLCLENLVIALGPVGTVLQPRSILAIFGTCTSGSTNNVEIRLK